MCAARGRLVREEEKEQNRLENSETKTVLWLETCLKLQASRTVLPFPFTLFKHVVADRNISYSTKEVAKWGPGSVRPGFRARLCHLLAVRCKQVSELQCSHL